MSAKERKKVKVRAASFAALLGEGRSEKGQRGGSVNSAVRVVVVGRFTVLLLKVLLLESSGV